LSLEYGIELGSEFESIVNPAT